MIQDLKFKLVVWVYYGTPRTKWRNRHTSFKKIEKKVSSKWSKKQYIWGIVFFFLNKLTINKEEVLKNPCGFFTDWGKSEDFSLRIFPRGFFSLDGTTDVSRKNPQGFFLEDLFHWTGLRTPKGKILEDFSLRIFPQGFFLEDFSLRIFPWGFFLEDFFHWTGLRTPKGKILEDFCLRIFPRGFFSLDGTKDA